MVVTRCPHNNACSIRQCRICKIVKRKQVECDQCATALPLAEVEEGHRSKGYGVTKEGV